MSIKEYVEEVHTILSNQGMGEKPSIRQAAATANVSVTGNVVTFDLLAGEGTKVLPGHVLSAISPTNRATAYCFYVLSVSGDTVTTTNGYLGASTIADASSNLDGVLFHHSPTHLEHKIHDRVNQVLNRFLYPTVFAIADATVANPSLTTGQAELSADVEKVLAVFQIDSNTNPIPIPFHVERELPTAISSTTILGSFDLYDGTILYYKYKRRFILGDEDTYEGLVELVATGAAALLMGATVSGTDNERTKRDSATSRPEQAAQVLWRDFLAQRDAWSEDISRETVTHFYIER